MNQQIKTGWPLTDIDAGIAPCLKALNSRGFPTIWSCSGLAADHEPNAYPLDGYVVIDLTSVDPLALARLVLPLETMPTTPGRMSFGKPGRERWNHITREQEQVNVPGLIIRTRGNCSFSEETDQHRRRFWKAVTDIVNNL